MFSDLFSLGLLLLAFLAGFWSRGTFATPWEALKALGGKAGSAIAGAFTKKP